MYPPFRFDLLTATLAFALLTGSVSAAEMTKQPSREELETATRLQVFLDRARFAPGKIDGRYGEFTTKSLALYREAQGQPSPTADAEPTRKAAEKNDTKPTATPDVSGLDLASVDPVFISYTVTEDDLKNVGELPAEVPEQAKLKSLPYASGAEAISEKFHLDQDFLAELNPGKTDSIKVGDVLNVPNVEPFDLGSMQKAVAEQDAKVEKGDGEKSKTSEEKTTPTPESVATSVKVNTATNMLTLYENDKLIAAYPVTIGSEQTESPVGDWKVKGVAKMPDFRWDKAMLDHGERSGDYYMLPPGPNNPVGVMWIQLSKKGIGLHGTSDPDAIGRSASHGCIRLANWDIVRLAEKVKGGVPVSLH